MQEDILFSNFYYHTNLGKISPLMKADIHCAFLEDILSYCHPHLFFGVGFLCSFDEPFD